MMMMSKSLPYDAEIEYLEGGDKPYIDTGVSVSNLLEFEGEMGIVNPTSNIQFGGRKSLSVNSNALLYNKNTKVFEYRYSTTQISIPNVPISDLYTFNASKSSITINNVVISFTPSAFDGQTTFCLFACKNQNGSLTGDLSVGLRMKWIKLHYDDTIVRDFIPVRVGQVGYMYDKVSGQLFGNQGTGNFVLGADKA